MTLKRKFFKEEFVKLVLLFERIRLVANVTKVGYRMKTIYMP